MIPIAFGIPELPPESLTINLIALAICFIILTKSADYLVDGAVGIAVKLDIPKMIIGIVLVGFGTTTPEFIVSMIAALRGESEIALGNAVGSVNVDSLALAFGILAAPAVIKVPKGILKTAGVFLIVIDVIAYIMCLNNKLGRGEGIVLVSLLVGYIIVLFISESRRKSKEEKHLEEEAGEEIADHVKPGGLSMQFLLFGIGLGGVLFSSKYLVDGACNVATIFGLSKVIIGMTLVAIGTSLPEIATCIIAARKGHGDLAFGDIIGADILNILWIAGGAAIASPMELKPKTVMFMFPSMLIIVILTLGLAAMGYKLQKWKGWTIIAVFTIYMGLLFYFFPPKLEPETKKQEAETEAVVPALDAETENAAAPEETEPE